jgi:hypothetical protein
MGSVFTVFHDGQFWVGLLEIVDDEGVRAARVIFGDEPTGPELATFAAGRAFHRLLDEVHVAPAVPSDQRPATRRANAKRGARQAARTQQRGVSTAAQAAMAAALEAKKAERQISTRQRRHDQAEYRRSVAVAKAKAKRRGR